MNGSAASGRLGVYVRADSSNSAASWTSSHLASLGSPLGLSCIDATGFVAQFTFAHGTLEERGQDVHVVPNRAGSKHTRSVVVALSRALFSHWSVQRVSTSLSPSYFDPSVRSLAVSLAYDALIMLSDFSLPPQNRSGASDSVTLHVSFERLARSQRT